MNKWRVEPLKSVNGITFGMSRKEVRNIFPVAANEFKKSKFSKNTADDFGMCHVYYNINDECEAVEIFDEITVLIDEKIIFPTTLVLAEEIIGAFEEDFGSYVNKQNSVGIYAPKDKMESILFGNKGYYTD